MNSKYDFLQLLLLGMFLFIVSAPGVFAGTATLNWNPNQETDLAGYVLYYDTVARTNCPASYANSVPLGKVTTYAFNTLPEGHEYYFQLTAKDTSNLESPCSARVSKVITYLSDISGPSQTYDRKVDIYDYALFFLNYGSTTCSNKANIAGPKSGTCAVDIADYVQMFKDYGLSF